MAEAVSAGGLPALRERLHALADPGHVKVLQGYFKTGAGQYGEGDRFLGLRVPVLRKLAREFRGLPVSDALELLRSSWHEERLLALLLLVDAFSRGDAATREEIYRAYLANTRFINNWDLVDSSAPQIVGAFLGPDRIAPLLELARSESLWERRIAILATQHFIRQGVFEPTLRIAGMLLHDREDLIHKAVGWMLREVGQRDRAAEEEFLHAHCRTMPRTMLRYAIERFPEPLRRAYLSGEAAAAHA
ncbi:MAG TPA: DNA alkylation repair protein [Longimicrobium sp.]|nr:DNA alkylation repair protein [Longimicrobium sp.]